jgi:hypothetical protein
MEVSLNMRKASAMDLPFRPDIMFVAQRRRGLLRQAHPAATEYGVFHSIVDPQAAINRFIKEHNEEPRPFVWSADPNRIIAAVRRGDQTLESIH